MSGESPVNLLRQAAEAVPSVLSGPLGEATAAWLLAEAECHEAVPEVGEAAGRLLASVASNFAEEDVSPLNYSVTVSTLDKAEAFAREVLALAEQQQARPAGGREYLAAHPDPERDQRVAEFFADCDEDPARNWHVGDDPGPDRALMADAAEYVINGRHASVSAVQRNVRVGFAKAARLVDLLETWGVVGPADGSRAREVLVPKDQCREIVTAIRGGAA